MTTPAPGRLARRLRRGISVLTVALATLAASIATLGIGAQPAAASGTLYGVDVSHYQGTINWTSVKNSGQSFAYIKATEGTSFHDPNFSANYTNAYYAGMIRGAYHFATPNSSSGAAQADYFAGHGGGWSADNRTLPGLLDIEYGPSGSTCWGLSQSSMVSWIHSFINEYHARTTRWAVIYTTTNWWSTCTGNSSAFAGNSPLFIARYSSSAGTLPAGWGFYTFWQYTSTGSVSGISGNVDRDQFNGASDRLLALANNTA